MSQVAEKGPLGAPVGSEARPRAARLVIDAAKCTGCRSCELVCSLRTTRHSNASRARISIVRMESEGTVVPTPIVCQQCEDPLCVLLCPAGALSRAEDGIVVVDEDVCIGCRTCVEVCPFGAPSVDPRSGTSRKCTLCESDPACVKVCATGALSFTGAEEEGLRRKRAAVDKYLVHLRSVGA